MVKGFINFKDEKLPFVIEEYRMELFADEALLMDFSKEYNYKKSYILHGQCFDTGIIGRKITVLVEYSMGNTCYLRCYIINVHATAARYDAIGLQSPFLDDIFRYKYEYLDMVREGVNLASETRDRYEIPFAMNGMSYKLKYRIGHNQRQGLLEDFDKKGEILVPLQTKNIQECYEIAIVLHRLAMFMMSTQEAPYRQIILYNNGIKSGWFYCPLVSEESVSQKDLLFYKFSVMKYIPKVLNNLAIDPGYKISRSIPLGHLRNFDTEYSPQRFLQQVMSFEYLFDKLEHSKAKDRGFPLKSELQYMFNEFPQLLSASFLSPDEISEMIKEMRRQITHGYTYYYDFKNDPEIQYVIIHLDRLIKNMSLRLAGFTSDEILEYPIHL